MSDIRLRPATGDDARSLWQWRNEPATRAASFNTEPIAYDEHVKWLATKLRDGNVFILIAVVEGEAEIGYVRLDIHGDAAEMSLSLDRAYRGRGLGSSAMRAATEFAVNTLGIQRVMARVRPGNAASLGAFRAAGFWPTAAVTARDSIELAWRS
jgi:UDP-2,4-diacetamido-2,4,6-trideoxy-beta-L-altropyranose hydrolase